MAQVARAAPGPSTSAVAGGRSSTPARNFAKVDGAPIEEISPKIGAHLDDGNDLFHEFGKGRGGSKSRPREPRLPGVHPTSQAFAAIIEFEAQSEHGGDKRRTPGGPRFAGLLAKAIATYETNALVIGGGITPRGSSLSLSL